MARYWLLDRFVIILPATARGGIDLAHTPCRTGLWFVYGEDGIFIFH
jgi:hypothetical protein